MLSAPLTPAVTNLTLELVSTPRFPKRRADVNWTLSRR